MLLGVCWISFLLRFRKHLTNTTLTGPWNWAFVAAITVIATILLAHTISDSQKTLLNYLAAITTCCPVVALLGAKKPQNRAWQWIVGSLWIVLSLPAFQAIAYAHANLSLGAIWTSLLWILIFLPFGNYLTTRYFVPALLTAIAQVFLFIDCGALSLWNAADYLNQYAVVSPAVTAMSLLLIATLVAEYITPKHSELSGKGGKTARLWFEFSQLYGILWSKRVADRAERLLNQLEIPLRISSSYFYIQKKKDSQQQIPADQYPSEVEVTLKNLLRRFVSQNWMEAIAPTMDDPIERF